jgi:superfamily I DNA/RNA helicase
MQYPLAILRLGHKPIDGQPPQTIVGTYHSVKGSEADVVLLFPELSKAGFRAYSHRGAEQDAVLRAFYVGLTRARESVLLADPSMYEHFQWPV